MINPLPQIKRFTELDTVGFYEFKRMLICPFGGISELKIIDKGELPKDAPSKQLIIGKVYHELMHNASLVQNKSMLIELAETTLKKFQEEFHDYLVREKLGHIRAWPQIGKAFDRALEEFKKCSRDNFNKKKPEILFSQDDRFKGVPDKYSVGSTTAYLTEYKSSSIFDDGNVKIEYIDQIRFYAFLLQENFKDIKTVKACLKSLNGELYEETLSSEEIAQYGAQLRLAYEGLEGREQEQVFELENCLYCSRKVLCHEFSKQSDQFVTDKQVYIVRGKLRSVKIEQNITHLKIDDKTIKIKEPFNIAKSLKIGDNLIFYNLAKARKNYFFTHNSGVYEQIR